VGGVTVFVNGGRPEVHVGDRVVFFGPLRMNRGPTNPGQRDRARVYERSGSYAVASLPSADSLLVLNAASRPASMLLVGEQFRETLRSLLDRYLSKRDRQLQG
jgi:hypothetical protein